MIDRSEIKNVSKGWKRGFAAGLGTVLAIILIFTLLGLISDVERFSDACPTSNCSFVRYSPTLKALGDLFVNQMPDGYTRDGSGTFERRTFFIIWLTMIAMVVIPSMMGSAGVVRPNSSKGRTKLILGIAGPLILGIIAYIALVPDNFSFLGDLWGEYTNIFRLR